MSLNIHNDSRNRGLEVLLYHPEKKAEDNKKRFQLKIKIPIWKQKEIHFQFDSFIEDKSNYSENN